MGRAKEFRYQSSSPLTPDASTATYWVNNSGILHFTNPNGTSYQANQLWASNVAMLGQTPVVPTQTGILTGAVAYLPVVGPSGQSWCIPVYNRV